MKFLVVLTICLVSPAFCAYGSNGGYNGPLATPVINPNGFLADTPDVAAAKAAHYAEVSKVANSPAPAYNAPAPAYNAPAPAYNAPAPAYNAPAPAYNAPAPAYNAPAPAYNAPAPAYNAPAQSYNAPNYNRAPEQPAPVYERAPASGRPYTGPPAKISVSPAGFIVDTPEVAAEKAAHFSLVAKAQSAQQNSGPAEQYDDGSYKPEAYNQAQNSYSAPAPAYNAPAPAYNAPSPAYNAPAPSYSAPAPATYNGGYQGPQASPVVNPTGFLVDTPEVAAAKAAHFSEFSKSQGHGHARYRRGIYVAPTPAHTVHLAYAAPLVAAAVPLSALSYSAPYTYYGHSVRVHG